MPYKKGNVQEGHIKKLKLRIWKEKTV